MLYLVEDRDYIKIGFTTDLKQRKSNYETNNCYAKFIDWKPGTRADETYLHERCKKWLYNREWFYNVPEIHKIWNEFESNILNEFKIIHENIHLILNKICNGTKPESISQKEWMSIIQSYSYHHFKEINMILDEVKDNPYYEELKQYKQEFDAFVQFRKCCIGGFYSDCAYDFGELRYEYTVDKDYNGKLKIFYS